MNLLRDDQIERYARHILLREVGGRGQARLLRAAVAIEGLEAPGGWVLAWLALAGVGRLHLLDPAPLEAWPPHPFLQPGRAGQRRDRALAEALPAYNPDLHCTWGALPVEDFALHLLVEPPLPARDGGAVESGAGGPAGTVLGAERRSSGHGGAPLFWLAAGGGAAAMGWLQGAPPCADCAGISGAPLRTSAAARAGSLAASRILAFLLGLETPAPGIVRWEGSERQQLPPCPHR